MLLCDSYSTIGEQVNTIKNLEPTDLTEGGLRAKLHRLKKKLASMKRNKQCVENELDKTFHAKVDTDIPDPTLSIETQLNLDKIKSNTKDVVQENRSLKRSIITSESDIVELEDKIASLKLKESVMLDLQNNIVGRQARMLSDYKDNVSVLARDNAQWNERYQRLSQDLDEIAAKLTKKEEYLSKLNTRNVTKKLKRRDEKLESQKHVILEQEQVLKENQTVIDDMKEYLDTTTADKIKLQKKLSYDKHKLLKSETSTAHKLQVENEKQKEMRIQMRSYQERISQLEDINTLLESDTFTTFEDGRYNNILRETSMYLLTECNVSMSKVNEVITAVMKNLGGKVPQRLPSAGCLARILIEAKSVAAQQVATSMMAGADVANQSGNCLHMDATTKYHHHYQGYEVIIIINPLIIYHNYIYNNYIFTYF